MNSLAILIAFARRTACRLFTCAALLLALAATAATGDPDSFDPSVRGSAVYSLSVQPDRSILLGGIFTIPTTRFARYLFDDSFDEAFNPAPDATVNCTVVQSDGKILVGGFFLHLSAGTSRGIARLRGDGTLDANFTLAHPAFNGNVNAMALQPNGSIILGGGFTVPKGELARIQADGTLDTNFPITDNNVNAVAVQEDGKILVGGTFANLAAVSRSKLGRLNADGTLDNAFAPYLGISVQGASLNVRCVALQADGKILVGGEFGYLGGTTKTHTNLGRLNPNGTSDNTFNPNPDAAVNSLAVQADGKILVGGSFTNVGGAARSFLARLNPDGTADTNFNVVLDGAVNGVALQANGKVLLAGGFNFVNGLPRTNFARLQNDAFTDNLTVSNTTSVQWLRGGSAPESFWVTFELSTNAGICYALLGNATRISSGWQLTGLSLPASGQIRARARTTGGRYSGSSGLAETVVSFGPVIAVFNGASTATANQRANNVGTNFLAATGVGSSSAPQTFTIKNVGATNLTNLAVTVTGANSGDFVLGALGTNRLAPNETTTFTVTFAPSAGGVRTAEVAIASNDQNQNPFRIPVAGAILPTASFTGAPTIGFKPLTVNFTDTSTGTITNRSWNFGDGSTTNTPVATATHSFPFVGTNTVILTVSGPVGTDTFTRTNYIIVTNSPYPYSEAVLADHPVGYWPLDEPYGKVAFDYIGTNNGTYTNALLGQPGNNLVDTHTAATFGSVSNINSFVGGVSINFATSGDATFSVECWANGGTQTNDSGIISKGFGSQEQFSLDCGSTNHAFRFFVRDADSVPHAANGNVTPSNTWHHLVGVCDESNGRVILYVDGISNASGAITPGTGLRTGTATAFGSRQSGPAATYDLQFIGSLEDVAIYNSALSASQVLSHYQAATNRPPPIIAAAAIAGTNLALSWTGGVGPYQVLMATDLHNLSWQPIGDLSLTNSLILPRTNAAAFYRVRGK